MTTWEKRGAWAIAVMVIALAVWGGFGVTKALVMTLQKWGDAGTQAKQTFVALNDTLTIVNRPCSAKNAQGQLLKDGTLCKVNTAVTQIGDIAVTSQMQVKQSGKLIDTASNSLNRVSNALASEVVALKGTTNAATGFVKQATTDLTTAQPALADLDPLVKQYTVAGSDLDTTIKSVNAKVNDPVMNAYVTDFTKHVDSMSASGDLMLADAQWKEHQLLHPDKVKLGFWTGIDAGALWFHSHLMPPIF
jgi:hypothetical protein